MLTINVSHAEEKVEAIQGLLSDTCPLSNWSMSSESKIQEMYYRILELGQIRTRCDRK